MACLGKPTKGDEVTGTQGTQGTQFLGVFPGIRSLTHVLRWSVMVYLYVIIGSGLGHSEGHFSHVRNRGWEVFGGRRLVRYGMVDLYILAKATS